MVFEGAATGGLPRPWSNLCRRELRQTTAGGRSVVGESEIRGCEEAREVSCACRPRIRDPDGPSSGTMARMGLFGESAGYEDSPPHACPMRSSTQHDTAQRCA